MNAINWLAMLLYFLLAMIMPYKSKVYHVKNSQTLPKTLVAQKNTVAEEKKDSFAVVSVDKMNVFYGGVDNPVSIAVEGVPAEEITAFTEGPISIQPTGKPGKFTVHVISNAPEAWVVACVGDSIYKKRFRLKEIPLPVAKLSGARSHGRSGNFRACEGIIPELESFDFEAKCKIHSYRLIRCSKNNDAQVAYGTQNRFSGPVRNLIDLAKKGDFYSFTDIKALCPGWIGPKEINSIGYEVN